MAAMAVTERAALRCTSWWSILRAIDSSWTDTTTLPGRSLSAAASIDTKWVPILGLAMVTPYSDTERSEEHTSEPQSLMRSSYAVFCLKKKRYKTETMTERPSRADMMKRC